MGIVCLAWYVKKEKESRQYEQILVSKLEMLKHTNSQDAIGVNANLRVELNRKTVQIVGNKGFESSTLSSDFVSKSRDDINKTITKINHSLSKTISSNLDKNIAFAMTTRVEGSDFIATFVPIADYKDGSKGYLVQYQRDNTLSSLENSFSIKFFFLVLSSLFAKALLMWFLTFTQSRSQKSPLQK